MNDEELGEAVQEILSDQSVAPRERAEHAVWLIGRKVGEEAAGLVAVVVRGASSFPRPRRTYWWHRVNNLLTQAVRSERMKI